MSRVKSEEDIENEIDKDLEQSVFEDNFFLYNDHMYADHNANTELVDDSRVHANYSRTSDSTTILSKHADNIEKINIEISKICEFGRAELLFSINKSKLVSLYTSAPNPENKNPLLLVLGYAVVTLIGNKYDICAKTLDNLMKSRSLELLCDSLKLKVPISKAHVLRYALMIKNLRNNLLNAD